MFFEKIDKDRLERLFSDLIEGVNYHTWHEVFPSVIGYESFLPQNFEEADQYSSTFRRDDEVFAVKMAEYPEFHDEMTKIVRLIIDINRKSKMWELYEEEEYPGISFALALAMQDIRHLNLYSEFLISVKPEFAILYLAYDIMKLIKIWGWRQETFYLLLVYWFSSDNDKYAALDYLCSTGLVITMEDNFQYNDFIQALDQFIAKAGYLPEEWGGHYYELFKELTDTNIFQTNEKKAEILIKYYKEKIEGLLNPEPPRPIKRIKIGTLPPRKRI